MSSYRKPSGRPPKPTSPVDQEKTRVRRHHASGHAVGRRNRPILTLGIVLATVIVAEIVYYVDYQNTLNSGRRSGWRRSSSGSTRGTRRGAGRVGAVRFDCMPSAAEARIAVAQISAGAGSAKWAARWPPPGRGSSGDDLGGRGQPGYGGRLYLRSADQSRLGFG